MEAPVRKISLVSLTIPILIEQILRNLMGTVNVFMIGNISDAAVGAVGVANQIINIVVALFMMLGLGSAVLINHEIGAGNRRAASELSMNAATVAVAFGAGLSIILFFGAEFFVRLVGLEDELVGMAATYLRTVGLAAIPLGLTSILANVFRCHGDARSPMIVVILNNILNIVGAYLVVFRPIDFPLSGVGGVAAVRLISECTGSLVLVTILSRSTFGFRFADCLRPKWRNIRNIISTGLMSGMESIFYNIAQVLTTSFVTGLGTVALSTKVYVSSIDIYACQLGFSMGQASQIIVGQMMGAGKYEEGYRYSTRLWRKIFVINITLTSLMVLFSNQIMGLFTSDPQIISIARSLFMIDILANIGRSFNHSGGLGLRAAGYIFPVMVMCIVSIMLCQVGLSWLFIGPCSFGIAGLWLALALDECVRGGTMMVMWRKKLWLPGIIEKNKILHGTDAAKVAE